MTALDSFLHQVTGQLSAAGIKALTAYQQPLFLLPEDDLFVTAGIADIRHEPPFPVSDGTAVPAQITLCLRLHGKTAREAGRLSACLETAVLPLLSNAGYAVLSAESGGTVFDRTLDRYVCEAKVRIAAVFTVDLFNGNEVTA